MTDIYLLIVTLMSISLLAGSLAILLRRMIRSRRFQPHLSLFLILPVGQLVMLYSFTFDTWTVYWMAGILMSVATDLILLVYTVSQDKKAVLEEEIRETQHLMKLEQTHYSAVEQRREELNQIREDFSARLAAVSRLVQAGKDSHADELVSSLAEKINQTKENPYCGIPVINAVLTEKAEECAAAGIELTVKLNIPQTLSVEPMHLCSIFSNLLDNAIAAAKKAKDADKPVIHLSSLSDGDYLFVKTVNPSSGPERLAGRGRGVGSRILTDIAGIYGGGYQTEYHDGIFTAVASLLITER